MRLRGVAVFLVGGLVLGGEPGSATAGSISVEFPNVTGVSDGQVTVKAEGRELKLRPGQALGRWTFMAATQSPGGRRRAVFEDFSEFKGSMVLIDDQGLRLELRKALEPTRAEQGTLYHGHTFDEVLNSDQDLLGGEILSQAGDPHYAEVAACFPPVSRMHVYSFVGTPDCVEKVGIFYGGQTPNFDPAAYVPAILKIREQGRVLDGLVGGWLPVLRFVYPEEIGAWSELVLFAPFQVEKGNPRVQPVWYRLCRIEGGALKWARYFDSYHPFPPRMETGAVGFYADLQANQAHWQKLLAESMQMRVPDRELADLARHSLVREMITRIGSFPKYGVFDRSYGGSEHDGFQDTFTADTTAMVEWGLFARARDYIDNYFAHFVRDDGSILYRGPETGQFGRMLTVVAEYANYTGDDGLLLKHRRRLDAVTDLLRSMRAKALGLPADHPAHGVIAGWCEADACIDPEPQRYMQPYLSNNTEAQRGFRDLGLVWQRIGRTRRDPELEQWGRKLESEAVAVKEDIERAIARSAMRDQQPPFLPAIAGVREPWHLAVVRDKLDPQFRSYRAFSELLYSGSLSREPVEMILNYRAAHRDLILGVPTAYGFNTHELAGFLSYGHAFGLLQHDFIREYLLTLYALRAHHYTRGLWTAPETRNLDPKKYAAPYCAPAQMVVPLLTRWMLVFEDPARGVLWLAKGTPRDWLRDGETIAVTNAPVRGARISFEMESHLNAGYVEASLDLPEKMRPAAIKLRLRVPEGRRLQSVRIDGRPWTDFDPGNECVNLPLEHPRRLTLQALFTHRDK